MGDPAVLRRVIVLLSFMSAVTVVFGILGATAAHGSGAVAVSSAGLALNPGVAVVLCVGALCAVGAYLGFAAHGAFSGARRSSAQANNG